MTQPIKGRGAPFNTANKFLRQQTSREHIEAIDDWSLPPLKTEFLEIEAASLVNKVDSPDVAMQYSMNPYNGCEHGCIYCYARNTHEYWGYSAGLDFESKIMVKRNAPQLLRRFLQHPSWQGTPLSLSGNTDCYQPAEQRYELTRTLIGTCKAYHQPLAIITKNAGVLRDADLLAPMAAQGQATVMLTITSLNESLRRVLEPRTTTAAQRLRTVAELTRQGIPTGVMVGPVIPGLNDHELPALLAAAAEAGATYAGYTFIRLNGSVQLLFREWLYTHFPDRANKVWHLIASGHGGQVNDSQFGRRMKGEGLIAGMIEVQFRNHCRKLGLNKERIVLDSSRFCRPGQQGKLF